MTADTILSRLDNVKQTGPDRWIACCPAHADKSPSMTIRALEDGRVLIHDFAGCSALEILDAVGLDWSALHPPRDTSKPSTRKARPVPHADALRCLAHEAWVVLICAAQIERGELPADLSRLTTAVGRIATACQVTGVFK